MEIIILGLVAFAVLLLIRLNLQTAASSPLLSNGQRILIDTSTLMYGRVLELSKSCFLRGKFLIPSSVVMEMQQIADGTSTLKRERARSGLDVLKGLQTTEGVSVEIIGITDEMPVDDALRLLAKQRKADLMTNDYNLAKVALVEGITVLNINELAQALRPTRLPGEKVRIKIVQKGAERDQGVGYREDGTMVVVDKAARLQGKQVEVNVTRTLQTAAGKMCFAELAEKH